MDEKKAEIIRKQLDEFIQREMESPEITDNLKAYAINRKILQYFSDLQIPLLFIVAAVYGGILGKIALATYALSKFGEYLDKKHKEKLDKIMIQKISTFAKENGNCDIEYISRD